MRNLSHAGAWLLAAVAACAAARAYAQMPPGGPGGPGGAGSMPSTLTADPLPVPPDKAAQKAFAAGVKSLNKAKEQEAAAANAANPDKKAAALEKVQDAYNRALDQFTEALSQKGDLFDAWNDVGYVHLKLGAFAESVDDYDHALALKADSYDAIEHRGEALLALDRVNAVEPAYMDLYSHDRARADRLMTLMQQWVARHRTAAGGVRPADIDSFERWVAEHNDAAQQAAAAH